jgi:hypothetical protein
VNDLIADSGLVADGMLGELEVCRNARYVVYLSPIKPSVLPFRCWRALFAGLWPGAACHR